VQLQQYLQNNKLSNTTS